MSYEDQRAARFGAECQQIFESEPFREFLAHAERQLMSAIKACPPKDDLGRYRLTVALQSIEKFWEFLEVSAADGELAAKRVEELQAGRKPFF